MKRLIGLLLLLPGLALAQDIAPQQDAESEAGDVAEIDKDANGALRERIRPVSGRLYRRVGRIEFSPAASVSIADAFFTKYVFGGTLSYHLTDSVAVGVRGGYALNLVSGAGQICTFGTGEARGCRVPTFQELDGRGEGQIRMLGGVDVQWAPIYGKVSLLAESFAHFDLYAVGGMSAVQYAAPDMTAASGSVPELTFGGNVGVGAHFFFTPWLALRAEMRDLIYQEKSRRLDGAPFVRNQFLVEFGLSVFLPSFVEDR